MGARAAGEFRLTPLAERDLEDIWYFTVDTWSSEQAEKYHAGLLHAFRELASGNIEGREVDVRRGYWKYPVGSHFVFYRTQPVGIEVVRVLHKRMNVSLHLPG